MKAQITNMPGYRFGDYLLVLSPHEDLRDKITKVKETFSKTYNTPAVLSGRPHITLVKFRTWEMMEEKIVNRLKVIGMGYQPFKVNMKDFGSFPSHTLYINVLSKLPVQDLGRQLRTARKLMKSPDNDPHFITEPYIAIARKLTSAQYDRAWPEYSQKQFTGSFIADSMLLIKRREGERAYQIVKRFDFMNLPVNTTQGALFLV